MTNFNTSFVGQLRSQIANPGAGISTPYLIGRVTHIVQGPNLVGTNIRDVYYKSPTDLGKITFQIVNSVQDRTLDSAGNTEAIPIFGNFSQLPLEGELVFIIPGPSTDMNESRGQRSYFYFPPYNVWNSNHHNAIPDLGDYGEYTSEIQRSYQDSSNTNQAINTSATGSLNMPLGPNFPEKSNIKALRQFTGDVIIQGRWGNSIRFGSTTATDGSENYWSKTGPSGSDPGAPITIIRNGQGRQENNIAWIPTVENINRDPSSIYLTQGQLINIDDINSGFSLASLEVVVGSTVTVSVPVQKQLTSVDTRSPLEQDQRIVNSSATPAPVSSAETTTTPPPAPVSNAINVVGDSQEVFGTYVVSLRAVDDNGSILASVSATSATKYGAYQDAVTQLKDRLKGQTLQIPDISKITEG